MQSYRHIQSSATAFPVTGTAALKPRQRHGLVVLEGGAVPGRHDIDRHARREALSRSRMLVLGAILACALTVGALTITSITSTAAAQQALDQAGTVTIAVQQGDSLWSIAHEHGVAGVDDGRVVSWIEQHNEVSAKGLMPGQRLIVPSSAA